jgi:hypothetical protein
VAVTDYDGDGDLDLFETCYGPDVLWQNQGDGTFVDVAPGTPLAADHHSVAAAWGDYDNDGWPDLFVGTFLSGEPQAADHLFRNVAGAFEDVTPPAVLEHGASHGVAWADFDMDGDVDLALANNDPGSGTHPLYVNGLPPERVGRSLQVAALDAEGRWLLPGATIVVAAEPVASHPEGFTAARLMDAGGGYSSQGATPVHVGLPSWVERVSVTATWFQKGQRRTATISGIDPARFAHAWVQMRLGVQ